MRNFFALILMISFFAMAWKPAMHLLKARGNEGMMFKAAIPATNKENIVTVKVTFTTVPVSPAATFTALANDKRIGFMFTKDDGGIGDYTSVFPVINGGTSPLNNIKYPGFTYNDGAGGRRKWGYTFAINGRGNALKDGSNPTVTTWKQYKEILANSNFILANHTADHSNTPSPYQQLLDNEVIIKQQLGVTMRTVVLPGGQPGFIAAGIKLHDILWSSEGYGGPGNASADGYDSEIGWNDAFDISRIANKHLIGSRHNLDREWTEGLAAAKAWVDSKFQMAEKNNSKLVFSAFAHGPGTANDTKYFEQLMSYIQKHPKNHGDVWFPNLQQFAEYIEVKNKAIKSPLAISGKTITFTINLGAVPADNKYKDMSLTITGGTLKSVEVAGADSYTFNTGTGLVNIYKGSTVPGAIACKKAGRN